MSEAIAVMTPAAFIHKWRGVTLKERSFYVSHFNDLCELVGHPTPVASDKTGASFTFERGAAKRKGGNGWADVWKKDFFAFEYKGKDRDLEAAFAQLEQYREDLENPPLLVAADASRLIIKTNFNKTVTKRCGLRFSPRKGRVGQLSDPYFKESRLSR